MSSAPVPAASAAPTLPISGLRPIGAAFVPRHYVHPGLSLAQLLAIVRARRKATLLILAAMLLLTILASVLMPRTYTSTATLMVNYEIYDPLGGKEFPTSLLGSYMATQIELMRSDEVLLDVVRRLALDKDPRYLSGHDGNPATRLAWVKNTLSKDLLIEQGAFGSQLIHITYSARTAERAAAVANAVASVFATQQYSRLTGPARERAQRYTQQLDELKAKVARAQDQVTRFRAEHGTIDATAKIDIEMQMLGSLEQRLLDAQNSRREAESHYSGDASIGDQVLGSTLVQTLKANLAGLRARMAELRATLGPRHPQVIELQSQIEHAQRSLAAEMGSYQRNASATIGASRQLEQKLHEAVAQQRHKVIAARQLQDASAKYELELQSAQSVYKRALDGYDQIMFASAGHYSNVRQVGSAEPPLKASKPKLLKNLLLGIAAGLLLGLLGPLAWDLLHRRVRCRDDIEREYGLPVLGEFSPIAALRSAS